MVCTHKSWVIWWMLLQGHARFSWKDLVTEKVVWGPDERKTPVFIAGSKEGLGNYRPIRLILIPGNMMEQQIPEGASKNMKDKKVTRSSQ